MKLNSILYFSVIFASLNGVAISSHRETEVPANSIYKSCGQYLYEQDNIVSSPAFEKDDEKSKATMLEDEFLRRRRICYLTEAAKVSGTLVPTLGGFYFVFNRLNVNNAAAGIGGTLLLYQVFGSVISDVTFFIQSRIDSVKSLAVNLIFPAEKDSIEKYELQYVVKKRHISKSLQEILEENFIEARLSKSAMGSGLPLGRNDKGGEKSPIQFAKNVLSLPTEKIEIAYNKTELEKYLGTYDKKVLNTLKLFAAQHAAASTGETVSKSVVYMQGPPGVGKTRAAKNLARGLDSPFRLIKLGGKSLADIEGDENKPGLILEALMSARNESGKNGKNPILFFDELDRALGMSERQGFMDLDPMSFGRKGRTPAYEISAGVIPFLLELFESETKSFYSPYLGTDVDISDVAFVAAGNVDWEIMLKNAEVKDTAMKDRFDFVRFEGYSPEFKLSVTKTELFDDLLRTYKKSKTSLTRSDFTTEDWETIDKMVLSDKEPGFREVIRRLKKYMARKALCKYTGECQIDEIDMAVPKTQFVDALCDGEGCKVDMKEEVTLLGE